MDNQRLLKSIDEKYHEKEAIMVNKKNKTWKEFHELKGYMDALTDVKKIINGFSNPWEF